MEDGGDCCMCLAALSIHPLRNAGNDRHVLLVGVHYIQLIVDALRLFCTILSRKLKHVEYIVEYLGAIFTLGAGTSLLRCPAQTSIRQSLSASLWASALVSSDSSYMLSHRYAQECKLQTM